MWNMLKIQNFMNPSADNKEHQQQPTHNCTGAAQMMKENNPD
jgi:hypothetical protein